MLILTRKVGERIFILDEEEKEVLICITLNSNSGGQARIGIDAGKSYTILREEVFLRNMQGHQRIENNFEADENLP